MRQATSIATLMTQDRVRLTLDARIERRASRIPSVELCGSKAKGGFGSLAASIGAAPHAKMIGDRLTNRGLVRRSQCRQAPGKGESGLPVDANQLHETAVVLRSTDREANGNNLSGLDHLTTSAEQRRPLRDNRPCLRVHHVDLARRQANRGPCSREAEKDDKPPR